MILSGSDNLSPVIWSGYVITAILTTVLILSYPVAYSTLPYTVGSGFIQFISDYRIFLACTYFFCAIAGGILWFLEKFVEPVWFFSGFCIANVILIIALIKFNPCGLHLTCYEAMGNFIVS